jgi:hypothetical protein
LSVGEIIYFRPYIETELGWEYISFLGDRQKPIEPKAKTKVGYGMVKYSEVFSDRYWSMRTSYECAFEEASESQRYDSGVRVCTNFSWQTALMRLPCFEEEVHHSPLDIWGVSAYVLSYPRYLG